MTGRLGAALALWVAFGVAPAEAAPAAMVEQLRIAPEGPRTGYRHNLFRHWVDDDGDGCDTREEVLVAESAVPARTDPASCAVLSGWWTSVYDGVSTDDPGALDIDHVVALGEAWDSGASAWDAPRRRAFANDLDEAAALIAVTASANRTKNDRDPAEWRPPRPDAWCGFAGAWVTVKLRWDLSADEAEAGALREMLAAC
ncbi:MAG: HNH endonuclease family protein [Acidimicrobiia bacterium]